MSLVTWPVSLKSNMRARVDSRGAAWIHMDLSDRKIELFFSELVIMALAAQFAGDQVPILKGRSGITCLGCAKGAPSRTVFCDKCKDVWERLPPATRDGVAKLAALGYSKEDAAIIGEWNAVRESIRQQIAASKAVASGDRLIPVLADMKIAVEKANDRLQVQAGAFAQLGTMGWLKNNIFLLF